MRNIGTICLRELRTYFNSPMAYIFLVIFAIVNGYFFMNTFFLIGQSDLRGLFSVVPLTYLFFVPAIAMGLVAREKNLGTMEIISTLPLKNSEFIIGKFLAAFILLLLGLAATLVHFVTLVSVGTNIDYGAIFSGYLGLALLGAVYTSVGLFASSVTENQVLAFIMGVFIVLVFFLMDKLLIFIPPVLAGMIQYLSVDFHLSNMSRGVIDSRNLIYFASVIGFFLFLSIQTIEVQRRK